MTISVKKKKNVFMFYRNADFEVHGLKESVGSLCDRFFDFSH